MLVNCPSCHTEYDCEPGRYRCECGAKFLVEPDGDIFVSSEASVDDPDVTISPRNTHAQSAPDTNDVTMPGRRGRNKHKQDGRFEIGDLILGRYKVLSVLGRGGMGMVYECQDEIAGIKIALKALPPELAQSEPEMEDVKDNFQLVSRLAHPNIAIYKQLEKDNSNGDYYLIMECVEGEDLRRWIKRMRREGSLTLETVLPVIRQVASALDYAHKQKIVHRDIKPGNIMIDAEGNVKVLDFGLAAQIHTSMTRVSMAYQGTSGTAPYMAPEQWNGWAMAEADQYALAVMTYEMLSGHLPFDSTDVSVLREAVLNAAPRPVEGLPEYAQAALTRGMAKAPGDRFGSCAEFAAALGGEGKAAQLKQKRVVATPVHPAVFISPAIPADREEEFTLAARTDSTSEAAPTSPPPPAEEAPMEGNGSDGKNRKMLSLIIAAIFVFVVGFFIFLSVLSLLMRGRDSADEAAYPVSRDAHPLNEEAPVAADSRDTSSGYFETQGSASVLLQGDRTITLPGNVKLEMVKVEAGSFEMSAKDGENYGNEVPHRATLTKDFYIGKTEVTQAQWKAVMGNNPSAFNGDNLPVEHVSWNDAMDFCNKLNSIENAPGGWKFTLPTETQWEYAARGGKKSKGYKYSGSNKADDVAWYYENSGDSRLSSWHYDKLNSNHCKTHPVGKKKPNELGLYDMSGNVFEWCLDDYIDDSSKLTAEFTRKNDQASSTHVGRGGCWYYYARYCRSAYRYSIAPGNHLSFLGFRVALVPAEGYGTNTEAASAATQQKPATAQTSTASGSTSQQPLIPAGDKTITLPGNVRMELVKVEAGTFTMSANDGENVSDEVAHRATLTKDFYIGRTEVTQAQWKAVMGSNPSSFKGDDLPVEEVSWNDAMSFCEKLNAMGTAPSGWRFTLPTETQWEYAARGGNKSKGYKYSGSRTLDEVAWYYENSGSKTHPVAQKKANELGLYDMSGNVYEWCLDDWNGDSSKQRAEFTRGNDQGGSERVRRGGGWYFSARFCRSAYRVSLDPGLRNYGLGFRVALVPESY